MGFRTINVALQNSDQFVLIDERDYDLVSPYKWYLAKSKTGLYYARTTIRKKIYMHRLIAKAIKGDIVDHINGNTLDCRLINLRKVTAQQNAQNKAVSRRSKSGIKGVSYDKTWNKWVAQIMVNGISKRAWFETPEDAALQYVLWSKEFHGEYGSTRSLTEVSYSEAAYHTGVVFDEEESKCVGGICGL